MKLTPRSRAIIELARKQFAREGELEIDSDAKVSECPSSLGGDNGAYVQAWVWVDLSDSALPIGEGVYATPGAFKELNRIIKRRK